MNNEETVAQIRDMIRELGEERDAMEKEMKQLKKKLEEYAKTLAEVDPVSAAALARRWREETQ